ncbi:MAG: MBL fold metallo-hydrolase [Candidatus Omnitrophota bacterium]
MISEEKNKLQVKTFKLGSIETNCYVAHDEVSKKGVLIDPGEYGAAVKKYIETEGLDILWTINTHGHADHILGNKKFGYPVMIHALDEPFLNDPSLNLSSFYKEEHEVFSAGSFLEDGTVIGIGAFDLKVIHTPGHTPGSVSIICGDMLFSGDTLFFDGVGRTDLPGGDQNALFRSIREKLMTLNDHVKVFPGHGPETTIGHERKNNPFL